MAETPILKSFEHTYKFQDQQEQLEPVILVL